MRAILAKGRLNFAGPPLFGETMGERIVDASGGGRPFETAIPADVGRGAYP